jgi:ribosomal protein L40E
MKVNRLEKMDTHTKLTEMLCRRCGAVQDAVAGDGPPCAGDIALCIKCGAASIITETLGRREPTLTEALDIDGHPEIIWLRRLLRTANEARRSLDEPPEKKV